MINPVCSLVMFEPSISFFVLHLFQQKLALSQAGVAVGVPHVPTWRPVAAGFAKVCAKDPPIFFTGAKHLVQFPLQSHQQWRSSKSPGVSGKKGKRDADE